MAEFGPLSEECEIESLERAGGQNITGTTPRRMNQIMKEYKQEKTIIDADEIWFNIIFKRRSEKWLEKGLTERVMGINTEIKKNPWVSRKDNIQLKLINDTD
jgi:hypothetical protein